MVFMKRGILFLSSFVLLISMCQTIAFGEVDGKFTAKFEYSQNVFTDISESNWYAGNVKKCYELGLMSGKKAGYFDASGNVTLAEALAMASRAHEIYNGGDGVIASAGTQWYDGFVYYAENNGIIKLGEFSNFNLPATREQLAYIFSNILPESEYIVLNNVQHIPDIDVVGPYDQNIYFLYNAGVLTGNDEYGTFNRESNITRAEVATILIRVISPADRVTLSKDAHIYLGNNPTYEKFNFRYTETYPGETKNMIDLANLKIYNVFLRYGNTPDTLVYLDKEKTSDLPKNADIYPYILSGIDNEIYEIPNYVSTSSRAFGPIKAYQSYYDDFYGMEAMIVQAYEEILNIDYETISTDHFYHTVKYALWGEDVKRQLEYYIDYVKKNKIKIEGSASPLFPIVYHDGDNVRVRTKMEYKIISSDTKLDLIFGDRNGNPGASREFYAPTEYVSESKTIYVDIPFGYALDASDYTLVFMLDDYLPLSKHQAGKFSVEGIEL
jgi:hypothetical protein